MAGSQNTDQKKSFKDTLNLPRTDFPIRAQAAVDDPALIARWDKEDLFGVSFMHNEGKSQYILHDGPPYANGHIHIGHAYNKILKDIVGKSKRMAGNQVPITPGWDCHGLPIEFKVSQDNPGATRPQLKKACRAYAQKWIDIQREEFKRLGVLMDWDRPYLTMAYEYESSILQAFSIFVLQGYIERKNKTVPWCPYDKTVLASAEIEYAERKDPSLYVLFALEQKISDQLVPGYPGKEVSLVIWTTTPWTLPLNRAVMVKPNTPYVILNANDKLVIVAAARADALGALLGIEKKVVKEFNSQELLTQAARVHHPFIDKVTVPIVGNDNVSLEDGTACVHCAPGCGPEDYEIGIKNNLEIFSPISPEGSYTSEVLPHELNGMKVEDGQIWVIKKLVEKGKLLHKASIKHSYPHCWRCHGPLIFRATKQWFCDLEQHDLKNKALQAIKTINAVPEKSINRLHATVEGRLEWCLSRQRVWGVPIPALLCKKCDYTYITPELVQKVAQGVAKEGVEYWDTVSVETLVPKNFACPSCAQKEFEKEQDILDVWFDSGISHYAVLNDRYGLRFPADIYVEGKDQHRGWFQSSLLTALVIEKEAPMKDLMTHGFTVDAQGRKMSKSLGNVVSPAQMMEQLGTDGVRLWVSSIDASADAVVSAALLENVKEVFRKIRNTARFLLSNLYDFDIQKDAISLNQMLLIDQYALHELYLFNQKIHAAYDAYDFTAIFHAFGDYCSTSLSSLYLDIIKDRLYVEKSNGLLRRSAQTACWIILDTLTKLMAPILSFSAEQISDHYQKNKKQSIHLQTFVELSDVWIVQESKKNVNDSLYGVLQRARAEFRPLVMQEMEQKVAAQESQWQLLLAMRNAVLKAIEPLREQGIIKHSLEASITWYFDDNNDKYMLLEKTVHALKIQSIQSTESFFKELWIVSQVHQAESAQGLISTSLDGFFVKVQKAQGQKCPRCWNWHTDHNEDNLCNRCHAIVHELI